MTLEKFLQDNYNYNPDIKNNIKSYITLWKGLYAGNVKDFHNYYIYNGQKRVKKQRYTLNMAKEISEDWSDTLWSEKCEISVSNNKSQKEFDKLVKDLDLWVIINNALEKAGGVGTSATVVSVHDIISNEDSMILDVSKSKIRIDTVDVDWVFPLSWNNNKITECAFGSVEYVNGQKYIVCSVHLLDNNDNYIIHNHLFRDKNNNLVEIQQTDETMKEFKTESNIPWFSVFKPLLTNNLFQNNPFGIPYYANAVDVLKTVDIDFDAFKNEVKDGQKRTFVRSDMLNYDTGEERLTFDPEDTNIYVLPKGATKDDLIQNDTDALRVNDQIHALNTSLNILGTKVGFGENHYHFDGQTLNTATSVISSNSKMFRRKKKLEVGFEDSIYDLVMAVCYASTKYGVYNINTEGLVIQFDDSIIEDKEAESNRALREYSAGLISAVEYRQRIFGESEKVAEQSMQVIQSQQPSVEQIVSSNEE